MVAAAGALWYVRPIALAKIVGVDWRATVKQSACLTRWYEVACTTLRPPQTMPNNYTTLQLAPVSRSVHRVNRTRVFADSTAWTTALDSMRRAMRDRKAIPMPCDTSETHFPIAEAWRVGREEVRLYAHERRTRVPYWFMSEQLVPFGAAGCGREARFVLLTPAEMTQRVQEWLAHEIGF